MTPVSFVKTTEQYEVSLVTKRQISYDSGILRQDYEIIRGLPMNHASFVFWVTIWVVHFRNGPKQAGLMCIVALAG